MHWTALGVCLGTATYFGVSRESGAAVFWAVSLSSGLCAVMAVRLRNGIARLLIVIAVVAARFSWNHFRAYSLAGPVLSERFYGAVQGRVIDIDRSLSASALLWTYWCWAPCRRTSRRAGCAWHCMEEHKSLCPRLAISCGWRRICRPCRGLLSSMAMIFKDRLGLSDWAQSVSRAVR